MRTLSARGDRTFLLGLRLCFAQNQSVAADMEQESVLKTPTMARKAISSLNKRGHFVKTADIA